MLSKLIPGNILFLDLETVPCAPSFESCPTVLRPLWAKKTTQLHPVAGADPATEWPRAGIYAEFGKIVCIGAGVYRNHQLRVKCYAGHDERALLADFTELLNASFCEEHHLLCAHNGKEFDFPYLARRILINRLPLPAILDAAGMKPWQVRHLDTMELWKFGDYKHYTSLETLAAVFNIPSPKGDINGADVGRVYWEEGDLNRIAAYCARDVVTLCRILFAYTGRPPLEDADLVFADDDISVCE